MSASDIQVLEERLENLTELVQSLKNDIRETNRTIAVAVLQDRMDRGEKFSYAVIMIMIPSIVTLAATIIKVWL